MKCANNHINKVTKKTHNTLSFLGGNVMQPLPNKHQGPVCYSTCMKPSIECASTVWGPAKKGSHQPDWGSSTLHELHILPLVISDEPAVWRWWCNNWTGCTESQMKQLPHCHDVPDIAWPGWHTTCSLSISDITILYSWPLHQVPCTFVYRNLYFMHLVWW
jgi:hypothetical protein